MARPNRHQSAIIKKRNKAIFNMDKKGYPLGYISFFHNLTDGRVVQILKKEFEQRKRSRKEIISRTDRDRK